jgi:DNA-binding MarR family transcriptional regulator
MQSKQASATAVPGPARPQDERLADLAELVLGLAREITFQTGGEAEPEVRLTATEIHVLRYIGRHPGAMPKDVARAVGLQRSNFSVALRSLRDKDLVAAEQDPSDGRSMRLFPTERSATNLLRHRAKWAAFLAGVRCEWPGLDRCLEVLAQVDEALAAARRSPDGAGQRMPGTPVTLDPA